jgi:hypothetical protein
MRWIVILSVVGVAAGYLARPQRPAPPGPSARTERTERICVEPTRSEAPSCEEVDLATRWCEARLATMQTPARLRLAEAEPQPELDQQLRAAFTSCGIAVEPVQTDCRELPCVVSVRMQDQRAVWEAVLACPALGALGFGDSGNFRPMVQQWPVRCPDGSTETMGLLTRTSDLDPLQEVLVPERWQEEGMGDYYALGQIGRRAEQLAQSWPCGQ